MRFELHPTSYSWMSYLRFQFDLPIVGQLIHRSSPTTTVVAIVIHMLINVDAIYVPELWLQRSLLAAERLPIYFIVRVLIF